MRDYISISSVLSALTNPGSFKTVNGMEACATSSNTGSTTIVFIASVFQNRKRYGGMRDIYLYIYLNVGNYVFYCFKTVNGMEACATVALTEGVATPRISGFWKVFWKSPLFDCVLRKNQSFKFQKHSVFVELTRSFRIGKCLTKTASVHRLQTLSKNLRQQIFTTLCAKTQEKNSTFEADGKFFDGRYVCDANDEKFYELLTRNYIGNDEVTDLNGYVDYRFVAIEPAWDGD